MNRTTFNEIVQSFNENEERLKSLKSGETIYEIELADFMGSSYFEHEVVSVDLDEMCVNTKDISQGGKTSRLYGFYTKEEAGL